MTLYIIILAGDPKVERLTQNQISYRQAAVEAAKGSPYHRMIIVAKWPDGEPLPDRSIVVEPGTSAGGSLANGIAECDGADQILIVSADLPHITSHALEKLLAAADARPFADAYIAFSTMADCARLNHTSKRAVTIDGRRVKLASIFLIKPSVLKAKNGLIGRLLLKRKSVGSIAFQVLGAKWLGKFLCRRPLKLAELEGALQKRNGFTAKGICVPAELAVDDDT